MSKAVLLSRVSTESQDLDQQTQKLVKCAEELGYSSGQMIIIEEKESAVCLSEEERKGLNRLKESIEKDDVKDVIVYELSRIARVPKILYSIRDFMIKHNVQLHCLNPSFKLLKDDGMIDESANVIFSLFVSLAENEGFLRKERLKRGKEKVFNEFKFCGGTVPYGYSVDKDKNFIVNEEEAAVIRRIFNDYQRMTISDIAKNLIFEGVIDGTLNGVATFVRTVLHRSRYCGEVTDYNGLKKNNHKMRYPAIISVETFRETQSKLHERKKYAKTKSKHDYICRGLLYTINGELMSPISSHNTYTWIKYDGKGCQTLSVSIKNMDSIVWSLALKAKKSRPEEDLVKLKMELQEKINIVNKKMMTVQEKLNECSEKIVRLESRFVAGKLGEDMLDKLESKIQEEIDGLNRENECLEADREALKKKLCNLSSDGYKFIQESLNELPIKEKNELIKSEIDKIIVIKNGRAKLTFGVEFKYQDPLILDYNCHTKRLFTEDGVEVLYN